MDASECTKNHKSQRDKHDYTKKINNEWIVPAADCEEGQSWFVSVGRDTTDDAANTNVNADHDIDHSSTHPAAN